MTSSATAFALNPYLAVAPARAEFARHGRVRIAAFLAGAGADALSDELAGSSRWRHVIKGGETVFEADPGTIAQMPDADRLALEQAMYRDASYGFQFRYDTIRVPDSKPDRAARPDLLHRFAEFMSGPETLAFLGAVTGSSEPDFADAQATRYRPGDFLTRHDDDVAGKNRRFAYVLGLSQDWRAEWGGLLLFPHADGQVEASAPAFNSLDLFAIGQPHSVSFVAPYAASDRISVTGWLRCADD